MAFTSLATIIALTGSANEKTSEGGLCDTPPSAAAKEGVMEMNSPLAPTATSQQMQRFWLLRARMRVALVACW